LEVVVEAMVVAHSAEAPGVVDSPVAEVFPAVEGHQVAGDWSPKTKKAPFEDIACNIVFDGTFSD
jgi:hypothetical protein